MNLAPIAELSSGNRTMVVILNYNGEIVSSLQSDLGIVKFISHTEEVDDRLFFGSPYNDYLGMITLDKVNAHIEKTYAGEKFELNEKEDEKKEETKIEEVKPKEDKKKKNKQEL